jgi:hypothetical protein
VEKLGHEEPDAPESGDNEVRGRAANG